MIRKYSPSFPAPTITRINYRPLFLWLLWK
jgi:hypothetical protein